MRDPAGMAGRLVRFFRSAQNGRHDSKCEGLYWFCSKGHLHEGPFKEDKFEKKLNNYSQNPW